MAEPSLESRDQAPCPAEKSRAAGGASRVATGRTWLLRCGSLALLLAMTVCYRWRPDGATFITLFPAWCWAVAGVALAWLSGGPGRNRLSAIVLTGGWAIFLLTAADSPGSLWRAWFRPERGTLRVATLNCASSAAAARGAFAVEPDILLLQESPSIVDLQPLAAEKFGAPTNVVWGVDASILARGKVEPVPVPAAYRENFVHARVTIDQQQLQVISLRLYPCPIRLDFWSPACWQSYRENREIRRRQLARIADYLETIPADETIILGGDFNCPPGDAVLRLLTPRLVDAFAVAGRGWGATIIELAGVPLIRIDQIWTSPALRATNAFAHPVAGTDHHMLVSDLATVDEPR